MQHYLKIYANLTFLWTPIYIHIFGEHSVSLLYKTWYIFGSASIKKIFTSSSASCRRTSYCSKFLSDVRPLILHHELRIPVFKIQFKTLTCIVYENNCSQIMKTLLIPSQLTLFPYPKTKVMLQVSAENFPTITSNL